VLRGQPVVDGQDPYPGPIREDTKEPVVGVEAADDEATSMVVDERRAWFPGAVGNVEAARDRARRPWDLETFDPRHGRSRRIEKRDLLLEGRPGFVHRQVFQGRQPQPPMTLEHRLDLQVQPLTVEHDPAGPAGQQRNQRRRQA